MTRLAIGKHDGPLGSRVAFNGFCGVGRVKEVVQGLGFDPFRSALFARGGSRGRNGLHVFESTAFEPVLQASGGREEEAIIHFAVAVTWTQDHISFSRDR